MHQGWRPGHRRPVAGELHDEERHADYLETQLGLIKELGMANYLAQKLTE